MKTTDIDSPDYAAGFSDRWEVQAGEGQLSSISGEHITKDGRRIFVDVNSTYITYKGQPAALALVRDVTQMREAEQALRDRHRELELVARVARAATSSLDIDRMLTEIVETLTTALDVTSTYVIDVDFEAETATIIAACLSEDATQNERSARIDTPFSLADRPRLLAWKTDPSMVVHWQHDDPTLSQAEREAFKQYGLHSALGIPLHSGGVVIGYLSLWEARSRREFGEAEVRLLQSIGGLVGVSLANAQLYGRLHASEERYRTLVELSPDAAIVVVDMQIVYVNRTGLDLYGAESAEQLIGTPLLDRVPSHLHEMVQERVSTALASDEPLLPTRSQAIRLDGGIVEVNVNTVGITYEGQRAVLALLRDVTVLSRAEERLQHYAYLLENASDAIISTDADLRIMTWNPAAEALYGWTESEITGLTIFDRVPTEFVDGSQEQMHKMLFETGHWKGEAIRTRQDGSEVHVLISVAAIRDDFGRVIATVGINSDITIIKEAEQDRIDLLEERARVDVLRRFVGDATHDLNTPLTNIRSSLYLLKRSMDEERRQKHLAALAMQSEKLEKLLDNMLRMIRLDDLSTAQLSFDAQGINFIVRQVAEQLAPTIERKGHHLDFALQQDLPQVMVDGEEIMRVLEEVLLNAVNYTPDGGHIWLRTFAEDGSVVIEIEDNGIGISAGDLPHIFNRFYRADPARNAGTGGTGLGLSLAGKIMEWHNGRIDAISTPDEGSTFRIFLPVQR